MYISLRPEYNFQVYDAVFLYASVVQESYMLLPSHPEGLLRRHESPKVMLERLLNKSSFNSGSTEEVRISSYFRLQ